jgi:hypothetical protein
MAVYDEKHQLEVAEKQHVAASSLESSEIASPVDYDDLPDPDVGKTDEERAKLVRPLVFDCHFNAEVS